MKKSCPEFPIVQCAVEVIKTKGKLKKKKSDKLHLAKIEKIKKKAETKMK